MLNPNLITFLSLETTLELAVALLFLKYFCKKNKTKLIIQKNRLNKNKLICKITFATFTFFVKVDKTKQNR